MPTPKAAIPNGVGLIANKTDQKAGQSQQKPRAIPHVGTAVKATPTPVLLPRADPVDEVALVKSPAAPGRFRSLGTAGGSSEKALAAGRELFERVWVKNDPRGHRGDGLGPVFNGQSCVGCHNLGGTGGAGGADRNIEIVTAADNVGEYAGYSYFMSMDFGAGKFEYRFGGDPPSSSHRELQADPRLLAAIHPGFTESRSVVLHRFGTDPMYNACASWYPVNTDRS